MTVFGTWTWRSGHQIHFLHTGLDTLYPTTHKSTGPSSEATHPQIQRWSGPAPCC